MCSCSKAFVFIRPCAIIVVGVAGSMPVHGIGTALFLIRVGDKQVIIKIFNCLLCHGEDGFNLLSVSQMLRNKQNSLTFSQGNSGVMIQQQKQQMIIPLTEVDGLYEIQGCPVDTEDDRVGSLRTYDLTLEQDPALYQDDDYAPTMVIKSPSKKKREVETEGVMDGYEEHQDC